MLSEALFFVCFLIVLPMVFMSPFAGALAYEWLQYMPPYAIYNVYAVGNLSMVMGGLALILWVIKDKKEKPAAIGLLFIFAVDRIHRNETLALGIPREDAFRLTHYRTTDGGFVSLSFCEMSRRGARICSPVSITAVPTRTNALWMPSASVIGLMTKGLMKSPK
jgi:hypothetical protein